MAVFVSLKFWAVIGPIILLQHKSFPTKMQTRGWSTSLQSRELLLLSQGGVSSLQVSSYKLFSFWHHSFSPYIQPQVTATDLYQGSSVNWTFCPRFSSWEMVSRRSSSSETTARQLSFDFGWFSSCVLYLVNSISVINLLCCLSVNKAWWIDPLKALEFHALAPDLAQRIPLFAQNNSPTSLLLCSHAILPMDHML